MNAQSSCDGATPQLRELEQLTRDYARYSRSAGGLGSVLGGALCIVSYLAGALLPLSPPVRVALIACPFVWVSAKIWLTQRYYQRYGHVEEQETWAERWTYRFCVGISVVVALFVTSVVLAHAWSRHAVPSIEALGYLALVLALPIAAWRWLRSPLDFIVGVFLFCQAALACGGRAYPLVGAAETTQSAMMSWVALTYPLAAVGLIGSGIVQHRRFAELRTRLEQLRGGIASP